MSLEQSSAQVTEISRVPVVLSLEKRGKGVKLVFVAKRCEVGQRFEGDTGNSKCGFWGAFAWRKSLTEQSRLRRPGQTESNHWRRPGGGAAAGGRAAGGGGARLWPWGAGPAMGARHRQPGQSGGFPLRAVKLGEPATAARSNGVKPLATALRQGGGGRAGGVRWGCQVVAVGGWAGNGREASAARRE